jgi:hypothetical protein
MTRSGKSLLIAGVLAAVAGSAYAADPQQIPQGTQQSYTSPSAAAAAAGATAMPATDPSNPEHFVKPPGYDQNPAMNPYSRPNYGPKPN